MRAWLRSLDPALPRPVYTLQAGGLVNAFGNGVVLPFSLIYLHNVRGIPLGTAGLILATNAAVSLVSGPVTGTLVDRFGGKRMLGVALVFLAVGYGGYALVDVAWHGFVVATITGIGNGAFWPAQSTLIAGLTPVDKRTPAFSMQRVVMNLGIGLGALTGGLVATADDPRSYETLFLVNGASFVVYLVILLLFVPEPQEGGRRGPSVGGYRTVLRHGAFVGVIGLNTLFIFAGFAGFELLPVYAKNEADVAENAIGIIFFVNTIVIVVAQLPISKLSEGHRRMRILALLGATWALSWVMVPVIGISTTGATAAALLSLAMAVFAIGECLHGAVQAPLVTDLADPRLLGRYMALSALSWQVGFALGPALGGFALDLSPNGTWLVAAAICGASGLVALTLERHLPVGARVTPSSTSA